MYHFFIHLFMDTFGCFYILTIINNATVGKGCIHLFKLVFWMFLVKYPQVDLLGHMVILLKLFSGTSILFFRMIAPIYNHTNRAQGFPFLHIIAKMLFVCLFLSAMKFLSPPYKKKNALREFQAF